MNPEAILKEEILSHFKSIRQFALVCGLPPRTVSSALERGVTNTGVSVVWAMCETLGISMDALLNGQIIKKTDLCRLSQEETDVIKSFRKATDTEKMLMKALVNAVRKRKGEETVSWPSQIE